MEVMCFVKAIDGDGDEHHFIRNSVGWSDLEIIGALLTELDRRRYHKATTFLPNDNGDEDEE